MRDLRGVQSGFAGPARPINAHGRMMAFPEAPVTNAPVVSRDRPFRTWSPRLRAVPSIGMAVTTFPGFSCRSPRRESLSEWSADGLDRFPEYGQGPLR
jgi:hypothetical protein